MANYWKGEESWYSYSDYKRWNEKHPGNEYDSFEEFERNERF